MDRDLARASCPHSLILTRVGKSRKQSQATAQRGGAEANDTLSVFSFLSRSFLPDGRPRERNGIQPWALLRIQHLAGCVRLTQLSKVSEVLRLW
jgi:hypothetical protein